MHRHRLAALLGPDDLHELVPIGVLVPLRLELTFEPLHELDGHVKIGLGDPRTLRCDSLRRPDLVGEMHPLELDRAVADAQARQVLAVAHHQGRHRRQSGLLHGAGEERVDLLAPFLRREEERALEVDGVDLVLLDEGLDVDRLLDVVEGRGVEVLVLQVDPLALLHLERFDDLILGNGFLVLRLADLLVADATAVRFVNVVEMELVLLHRALHPNRHADEPERDRA